MNNQYNYKPTEGEEFLEDFFLSIGIECWPQTKIESLKNDSMNFRIADFYLPKYKVFVEFFGQWNNGGNDRYKHKQNVYRQNRIPCVYIYPENLGIIDYTFDQRIQIALKAHELQKELRAYKFYKLKKTPELKNRIGYFLITAIVAIDILFSMKLNARGYLLVGVMVLIEIYQGYQLFQLYLDIFKRNKFSLANI